MENLFRQYTSATQMQATYNHHQLEEHENVFTSFSRSTT